MNQEEKGYKQYNNVVLTGGKAVDKSYLIDNSKYQRRFQYTRKNYFGSIQKYQGDIVYYFNAAWEEIGHFCGTTDYGVLNTEPIQWGDIALAKLG